MKDETFVKTDYKIIEKNYTNTMEEDEVKRCAALFAVAKDQAESAKGREYRRAMLDNAAMCDAAYSKALIAWTKANDLPIVTVRHYFTFLGFDTAEKIAQHLYIKERGKDLDIILDSMMSLMPFDM